MVIHSQKTSRVYEPELPLGSIQPRLWTPPLRKLTPETSYGFALIHFAATVLHEPLDPWQQWVAIHGGELLEDGRPRFRKLLVIVARQNGKTHLMKVFALFWLFVERIKLVLGTSTKLDYAAESWNAAVNTALDIPALHRRIPKRGGILRGKGAETLTTSERCRYKIGTADGTGGRSLPVARLICDELREHKTWEAYKAAIYAMNAQPHGQAIMISNQGDVTAVVLVELRKQALEFIKTGAGDYRLGLLEYSAPPKSDPMDPHAWAAANPNVGRRFDHDTIRSEAIAAAAPGADPALMTGFLTEMLCMDVPNLNPAIDPEHWQACLVPGDLSEARGRLAAFVDLAPDGKHGTLAVAAVMPDGRVRVETVKAWEGWGAASAMERELPGWLKTVRPQQIGWMPTGPAAAVAAVLADRRKSGVRNGWPPPGVAVAEVRAELPAVAMGFGALVEADQVLHSGQLLLDHQVQYAARRPRGDAWVFDRTCDVHVDALYAVAGAAHLARTMPTAVGKPRIVRPRRRS